MKSNECDSFPQPDTVGHLSGILWSYICPSSTVESFSVQCSVSELGIGDSIYGFKLCEYFVIELFGVIGRKV